MKNILDFFKKDNIGNPPWDYYFLKNLDEKEYPRYLAELFYINTGENLRIERNILAFFFSYKYSSTYLKILENKLKICIITV